MDRPAGGTRPARPAPRAGTEPAAPGATLRALDDVVGFRLRRLHALVATHWASWFQRLAVDVTPVQGGILLLIAENEGLTQIELARLLGVEPPTLLQSLNPLHRSGLVERRRSKRDRRALLLSLSEKGRDAAWTIGREIARQERDALGRLTAAERAKLLALLDKALGGGG